MKNIGLILASIAAVICFCNFVYKYLTAGIVDYVILFAGLFISSFGIANYYSKTKKS
jgi:hypothetical protein